jgi:hypothetical protein
MMIANISPATANLGETLSTLRFAQRVKDIRNKAVRNEDTKGDAAQLRSEIRKLREELGKYQRAIQEVRRSQGDGASPRPGDGALCMLRMAPQTWGRCADPGTRCDGAGPPGGDRHATAADCVQRRGDAAQPQPDRPLPAVAGCPIGLAGQPNSGAPPGRRKAQGVLHPFNRAARLAPMQP